MNVVGIDQSNVALDHIEFIELCVQILQIQLARDQGHFVPHRHWNHKLQKEINAQFLVTKYINKVKLHLKIEDDLKI